MFHRQIKKIDKIFLILLGFSAILFLVVGLAKTIFDCQYFIGMQYLSTALLFAVLAKKVGDRQLTFDNHQGGNANFLSLGFIFSVIGLNINVGVWGLGILLLLFGFNKY